MAGLPDGGSGSAGRMLGSAPGHVVRHEVLVEGRTQRAVSREVGSPESLFARVLRADGPGAGRRAAARRAAGVGRGRGAGAGGAHRFGPVDGRQAAVDRHAVACAARGRRGAVSAWTVVKEAVAEWKRQRREVFVPLTYRPGNLAEVDFFEVFVDVDGDPSEGVALRDAADVTPGRDSPGICPAARPGIDFSTGTYTRSRTSMGCRPASPTTICARRSCAILVGGARTLDAALRGAAWIAG